MNYQDAWYQAESNFCDDGLYSIDGKIEYIEGVEELADSIWFSRDEDFGYLPDARFVSTVVYVGCCDPVDAVYAWLCLKGYDLEKYDVDGIIDATVYEDIYGVKYLVAEGDEIEQIASGYRLESKR